jgi:hypothetical protein
MFTLKLLLGVLAAAGLVAAFSAALKREPKLLFRKPLTRQEYTMFHLLKGALPEYEVLAQVPYHRFLITKTKGDSEKDINRRFNFVRPRVVDFMICEKDFSLLTLVELEDGMLDSGRADRRDRLFNEAGLSILRWNANALPTVSEIQEKIRGLRAVSAVS